MIVDDYLRDLLSGHFLQKRAQLDLLCSPYPRRFISGIRISPASLEGFLNSTTDRLAMMRAAARTNDALDNKRLHEYPF